MNIEEVVKGGNPDEIKTAIIDILDNGTDEDLANLKKLSKENESLVAIMEDILENDVRGGMEQ